jgi:hypothetical protein
MTSAEEARKKALRYARKAQRTPVAPLKAEYAKKAKRWSRRARAWA